MISATLSRWWSRLGFMNRLVLSAGTALAVASVAMLYVSVLSEAENLRADLDRYLETELATVPVLLTEYVLVGDYATIEQTLKIHAGYRNIARLTWTDPRGRKVEAVDQVAGQNVPGWFAGLVDIKPPTGEHEVFIGGRSYGTLSIGMSTHHGLFRLWTGFLSHLVVLALAVGLDFIGIVLILSFGLRPLDSLVRGAQRLGGGDLATRVPEQGSPEFMRVTRSFNQMAVSIQELMVQLHHEKELADVTLHSIGDAVITCDPAALVTYLNPVAEALTGWVNAEAQGRPLSEVFDIYSELTGQVAANPVSQVLREGGIVGLANHTVLHSRGGKKYSIEDSAAPIRDADGTILGVVMVFHDVTEKREMARRISWQASHDALTGLVNRREFEQRLQILLNSAWEKSAQHYLLYLDLDQFKVVNDTCGHFAGDELLRQVTQLLQARVRDTDTLARLGGDEFGVLLEGCPPERARQIAENLVTAVHEFRFPWRGKVFVVGASVGVAAIDHQSVDVHSVLSEADTACYIAKEKGRNRVQFSGRDDAEYSSRRGEMQWVSRLNHALENDRFQLWFQRITPLYGSHHRAEHVEILVRLRGEDGSLLLPGSFIPAAERFNLMARLDRWVIATAFQYHARRYADEDPGNRLWSINLSGVTLTDEAFPADLEAAFRKYRVPPQAFCFEITETAAIANLSRVAELIRKFQSMGCQFSLDDFGSGLSSFGYLKALPVDYLKIDGSFVRDMAEDGSDFAIVESINRIGHALGIETIAEFVQDEAILERLKSLGVDYAQGYHLHRPEPLDG